jgi:transposase
VQERRQIVEETLAPGASVARVARAHGVNANQVFSWRMLYRRGRLGAVAAVAEDAALSAEPMGGAALVPVTLSDAPGGAECAGQGKTLGPRTTQTPAATEPRTVEPGTIHIQLRKARLRIEGRADPAALRAVLEALGG